ncbi:MAG TPA: prolyl oligopeptidase family serine peptidase [Gammaproteobacteria bacterium]|nr:prolyl oligopeptidase family serine peptidase [Gammaproteobacteria bacterium]
MLRRLVFVLTALCLSSPVFGGEVGGFTLAQALSYPYPQELVAAPKGTALAWVQNEGGVRNVWMVDGPGATPHQLTHYSADDGQEITQLRFSPDCNYLLFVRGGDHDANWPEPLEPEPDSSPVKPAVQVWVIFLKDDTQTLLGEGDAPAISPDSSKVAFIREHSVWWSPLAGSPKPQALFFDRGHASDLAWSPDGTSLAFVSDREDHSFIGIYRDDRTPIEYLAPSTNRDFMPVWSPDGNRIAFVRMPGDAGAPQSILKQVPNPWSIWLGDVASAKASLVWQSPKTLHGSYPETEGEANLHWLAGDRLLFLADLDNWPHLYTIASGGGTPRLLTPGKFMVEHVSVAPDGSRVVYSANTGDLAGDQDRRHLYMVSATGGAAVALTRGTTSEWTPKLAGDGETLGFIQAGVQRPPLVMIGHMDKADWQPEDQESIPAGFPATGFVTPQPVTFKSADGLEVHGQLFAAAGSASREPGIVFVHGGPPRQMLLTWHYMDYYSNAYAVNQYLASHGFVVLSVNYRLGVGYGHDYHHPAHWGPTGASEYQDVVAGARFLMRGKRVDAKRIGIWGGSYGGYLTAMGLARNSDIFKAGVDFHGVHDWSYELSDWYTGGHKRYEQGDRQQAFKQAYLSSPIASVRNWKSPVLLIQGDDDRNVYFNEMIDLANRLQDKGVHYEELVFPNEIHGFLRHASWLTADEATVEFFQRQFGIKED